MSEQYFLGVDGGGTGCRARLTDAQGRVLGEGRDGPANLSLGVKLAMGSILAATRQALAGAGLTDEQLSQTHAGLGIAAANVPKYRQALRQASFPFLSVAVRSDAETACLGAHSGRDGGILILGTGSQGVVLQGGAFQTVGGWGFALSDYGSGAILGRAAVRRAFLSHEGVEPHSPLTTELMKRFQGDAAGLLDWAENAQPRDWADFARMVFRYAEGGDRIALELVQANVDAVERMLDRMIALGAGRISLMGGIARPTLPYLSARFEAFIVPPEGDAMDGALLLAHSAAPAAALA